MAGLVNGWVNQWLAESMASWLRQWLAAPMAGWVNCWLGTGSKIASHDEADNYVAKCEPKMQHDCEGQPVSQARRENQFSEGTRQIRINFDH